MQKHTFLTILSILLIFFSGESQTLPTSTQDFKGIWVTGFKDNVLGNTAAEDSLLQYAQDHDFNYLICTNMFQILTAECLPFTSEMTALKNFINKAHTVYGIEYVSGNVGSEATAQKIQDYNQCAGVANSSKFDMITYECEFYNSGTNGSCQDFASYYGQLQGIKTICDNTLSSDGVNDLVCEAYIGGSGSTGAVLTNSSESEMEQIATTADHVLVTYYRSTPSSSGGNFFNWTIDRLEWLAQADVTKLVILLKSRDTDGNNMYNYLSTYSGTHTDALKDPYFSWVDGSAYNPTLTDGYVEQFNSGALPWLSGIQVVGYTWFEHLANLEIHDSVSVGIVENELDELKVFPNPAKDILSIETSAKLKSIELMDASGRKVIQTDQLTLQLGHLEKGVYFLYFKTESGKKLVRKIICE